ncbi:AraC family transcriptional regulator [Ramlibacter alkalitolerans]|uniref:AraC family transcriptional regulator n=1 Tax=Ramlibacter alkalitolerans TaxID=2039631 RepID=A0ABS1JWQ3_9BURK|nr:AraC family transcriptional regulator [Ramlibacter alkalitolerans]MBL0428637.1 AraC family transcriptional regulator [Ramlibacter alkalitolerans]
MTEGLDKGTISVGLVREAVLVAAERGLDLPALVQQAGIEPALLEARRARVPAATYACLWSVLADAMDDEFFGMDTHPMRRGSFRLLCHAALSCHTLGHALQRMFTFLRVVLDDLHGELRCEGDDAWIVVHDRGAAPNRMFTYATWLMLVHGLACWLVRRRIPLLEARFRCAEPEDTADYRTRFCETASFDAPITQVRIDANLLGLKVVETEASLVPFLREAPANLLVKYRNDASLSIQIRHRLRAQAPQDWPELDTLARVLHMSNTTVQRRLHAEGLKYQRLKDDLRRDIAIELLSGPSLAIAEVAERVGFQEPSAFHRAFKKWTGVSPGSYRRAAASPGDSDETP